MATLKVGGKDASVITPICIYFGGCGNGTKEFMKLKLIRLVGGEVTAINLESIVQVERVERADDTLITLAGGKSLRTTVPFDAMLKVLGVEDLDEELPERVQTARQLPPPPPEPRL